MTTNKTFENLEAALMDDACVSALRVAEDADAVRRILKDRGVEVDEGFAQALIQKRDAVLAGDELDELALEVVAGGKGFGSMFLGMGGGAAVGMAVAGPPGAIFGGLVGAIIGGLG